jgi:hypothetical protein
VAVWLPRLSALLGTVTLPPPVKLIVLPLILNCWASAA